MDTLYTLIENGVLELGNVFESCIRWLGWGLITLLAKLVNGIESTANKVYTINGFFNSSEVNQLIDKYEPLVWTILAISIGILGFRIIFNRQQNRISRHGWKIRRRLIQLILQCILVHRLHPDFTKRNLSIHISV